MRSTACSSSSAREHGNVCAVGDQDQSVYGFRGADIRNITEFESDFPGTHVVTLEQNYRSTNSILRAANAVIEQNTERKPKHLFSDLGEGEPVRVVELEDEHSEARFVAAEIAGLIDQGLSASEIAVFYRTNAQSRVLEDVLVRQDVPYQVIGGPRFYERAEIRDATAYLTVLVNPSDAGSLLRIANRPRRGIGDTSLARVVSHADTTGRTLWDALADPEAAGVTSAACRAIRGFRSTMESLMAQAQELPVDELLERMLEKTGILDAYEAERTIEARGRIENLQELVGVAREYRQQTADASLAGFLQDISLVSDQDTIADDRGLVTLMTLHNAKGLEFRIRVRDRDGGGHLPAHPRDRGAGRRGGAPPLLRRDDPCDGAADHDAHAVALALGATELQPRVALPRRAAARGGA